MLIFLRFKVQRFRVQRFRGSGFKVQRFRVQKFRVQRFGPLLLASASPGNFQGRGNSEAPNIDILKLVLL
jgi:hypothetical protein